MNSITTKEELASHFAQKVQFFFEEEFEDGPTLEDLLEEMLNCYDDLKSKPIGEREILPENI